MNVFITGGLGFVGRHLANELLLQGHEVTVTSSGRKVELPEHAHFRYIQADTTQEGDWQQAAATADILINLAGRTIFKRWNNSYKQQIYSSRVLTTRNLVAALPENGSATLISTSAVGFYGNQGEEILLETAPSGTDFLAELSRDWEAEALGAGDKGVRVAIVRLGIVLGKGGGALSKMLPAFKSFVGGAIGNGRHWVPWIHMKDLVAAIIYIMEHTDCRGPFNFSAPAPVRYRDFASALGRALGRPSFIRTPAFVLRLAMGELGNVLLGSQRAVPHRLIEAGYKFQFTDIDKALVDLTQSAS